MVARTLALVSLLLVSAAAHAQTPITTCGQVVSGSAVLVTNLDCSAAPLPSLTFASPGTFDLDGHTLTGEVQADVQGFTVTGPGKITGIGNGIVSAGSRLHGPHIRINGGADISENDGTGILVVSDPGNRASVKLDGALINDNGGDGISITTQAECPSAKCLPLSKVRVTNAGIHGNAGTGIAALNISMKGASASDNGRGYHLLPAPIRRKLKLKNGGPNGNLAEGVLIDGGGGGAKIVSVDSVFSGNQVAIRDESGAARSIITLRDSGIFSNESGIVFGGPEAQARLKGVDAAFINHDFDAIFAESAEVSVTLGGPSQAHTSATDPTCGVSRECADLHTAAEPRLSSETFCNTSHVAGSGIPGVSWGLCSLD